MRYHLRVTTVHRVPVDAVWGFKTDPEQIAAELRPHVFRLEPGEMAFLERDGEALPRSLASRFRLYGVVPLRWPTAIVEVERGVRFVDESSNVLYRRFRHTHRFEPHPRGCRYTDELEFEPRWFGSLSAEITRRTFVGRHRHAAIVLPTDPVERAVVEWVR